MRALAPDLDPIIDDLIGGCHVLQQMMAGSAGQSFQVTDVDDSLSGALERLRAAHLTPSADAGELRDIFGVVESLSLIAQGLTQVDRALSGAAHH